MATHLGMIQVSGTTYRLTADRHLNHVFRIRDDRRVGSFTNEPSLEVTDTVIGSELLDVAKAALRMGRLEWREPRNALTWRPSLLAALMTVIFALGPFEIIAAAWRLRR
jgi:hypothetical protein